MVNKVILVGNVGSDPEIKAIKENVKVATFRLATTEVYTDASGQKQTTTQWHNIVLWNGLATICESYVKKGASLYVEGKITYRSYEKEGQKVYFTEIVGDTMKMLGKKPEGTSSGSTSQPQASNSDFSSNPTDDLPF